MSGKLLDFHLYEGITVPVIAATVVFITYTIGNVIKHGMDSEVIIEKEKINVKVEPLRSLTPQLDGNRNDAHPH